MTISTMGRKKNKWEGDLERVLRPAVELEKKGVAVHQWCIYLQKPAKDQELKKAPPYANNNQKERKLLSGCAIVAS